MNKNHDEVFEIESDVEEKEIGNLYKVIITGDKRGFQTIASLYPVGESWTSSYKTSLGGQPSVQIIDNDCELKIVMNRGPRGIQEFTTNIGDIADLKVLLDVMQRSMEKALGRKLFSPKRISKTTLKIQKEI